MCCSTAVARAAAHAAAPACGASHATSCRSSPQRHRSGSLSTAARANDISRVVMAVPGPVTSAMSAGCNEWVRSQRAVLVTSAAEVLELLGAAGEHTLDRPVGRPDPRDGLSETVRRVLDAVPVRSPVGVARLARTAGVSALVVQQVLPSLPTKSCRNSLCS